MRLLIGLVLALGLLVSLLPAPPASAEVVYLIPEDRASWRARNLFGWLRPNHFYGERKIEIETTPPGATVDLFYVRSNFQKLYEQAEAPVTLILPSRSEAGPRDAVTIRASLAGFRQRETSIRVESSQDRVHLDLDPLPNSLRAVSHTYFAGRASLTFLTDESATVRVQEREGGVSVILTETGLDDAVAGTLEGLRSPLVAGVEVLQLGEDLLIKIEWAGTGLDLRSRRSHDPVRNLYSFAIDFIPADGGVAAVERARAALAAITRREVAGCATRFDAVMREELDPASLSRALAPRGAFTDPYLRAAMKRLGELSPGGSVTLVDGSKLRTAAPIELAAATRQAAQVKGYLGLLRSFVRRIESEQPREVLRSLLAPELEASRFGDVVARAESAEGSCRPQAASR